MDNESIGTTKEESQKLSTIVHVMCGWPLALVFIGGAIGGGLGGIAYGINMVIYKSRMPVAAKVVLNILTGTAAFITWAVAAYLIQGHQG